MFVLNSKFVKKRKEKLKLSVFEKLSVCWTTKEKSKEQKQTYL